MSKSDLSPVEAELRDQLNTYFADVENPTFILGVSGGMDSMSLLYAFYKLDINVLVVHINYGKRGEASDKDAELVEQMAFEWGYDCQTIKVDPDDAAGENFQQWARDVRYGIFRELAEEYEAAGIAVAHHEDDQIETILQKMFRGAGLASWTGMQVWDGELFRPWLKISQQQIEDYAKEKTIPFRTDASNLESGFARNFLRNEWLVKLENHFPGWRVNVLRMAAQAETFQHAVSWIYDYISDEHYGIDREKFHDLESDLQRAIMLHAVKQQAPESSLTTDSLKRVEELASLQTGQELELVPGISIVRNRDWYVINQKEEAESFAFELDRETLKEGKILGSLFYKLQEYKDPDFDSQLYIDADKVSWPVTVRRWKDGDVFQPLGMEGHQQVADHLTNRKVSAAQKHKALAIESFEERIIAVIFPPIENRRPPGTIADPVKCDGSTKFCLNIKHTN